MKCVVLGPRFCPQARRSRMLRVQRVYWRTHAAALLVFLLYQFAIGSNLVVVVNVYSSSKMPDDHTKLSLDVV